MVQFTASERDFYEPVAVTPVVRLSKHDFATEQFGGCF